MEIIASEELSDDTVRVLQRVAAGERIGVMVRGEVVAELAPVASIRPTHVRKSVLLSLLNKTSADSELRDQLALLAGDPTDDR